MKNNNHKINKIITIILVVASLFRLPFLNTHMPALYGDEIAIGYNAFSILKTGRDEFQRLMPLQFESWGDQKNPVYIYATTIMEFFFGATPLAVRLTSALSGIFAVYLTYLIARSLKLGEAVALLSALLLSLTPWHIHISRGGYEANLALTLGLFSVYTLLRWFDYRQSRYLFMSILGMVLAAYTYYTTKMFIPILMFYVWIWGFEKKSKTYLKNGFMYWLFAALLALPIIYLALFKDGQARFMAINIFKDKTVINRVERGRNFFADPKSLLAKIEENRLTYNTLDFLSYYFDNFSGQFLFVGGDSNVRYGLANHGMLYLLDAPLIIFGIIFLYQKNRKAWWLLVPWMLLAPLPTALVGKAYGLRSIAILPIPQIFAAVALWQFFTWTTGSKVRRILSTLFVLLYFLGVTDWTVRYIYQYPTYGRYWYDSAMLEALDFAKSHESNYDNIIITQSYGETSMYYAFYNQIDPRLYYEAKKNVLTVDGVPMVKIGKYYFGDVRPHGSIEGMDLPKPSLVIVQPYFEYGEGTIIAKDDGRPLFRWFGFPTVFMKEKTLNP